MAGGVPIIPSVRGIFRFRAVSVKEAVAAGRTSARHPRAWPGDLPTISHHAGGGCHFSRCPILHGVLGASPRMTAGGGRGGSGAPNPSVPHPARGPRDKPEDDGEGVAAVEVEGAM